MSAEPTGARPTSTEEESPRGVGEFVRDAWGQAVVAVNTAEEEVQRFLVTAEMQGHQNLLGHVGRDHSPETDHGLSNPLSAPPQKMDRVGLLGAEDF